uniref:Uncharacterized protein n=1 Tax=Arion vulgaris TaxID=1028688 RepID=A0A0B6YIG9_9EUPU
MNFVASATILGTSRKRKTVVNTTQQYGFKSTAFEKQGKPLSHTAPPIYHMSLVIEKFGHDVFPNMQHGLKTGSLFTF